MNPIFQNRDIILASSSPRRRELLTGLGIPFRVAAPYAVEEVYPAGTAPHAVPAYLSALKSNAYPQPLTNRQILLTADTVVIHSGQVIGKPQDAADAARILRQLAAATHEVVTGITLRDNRRTVTCSETARVTFGPLSDDEITYYVDTYRPMDKAGAYGIQEWIGYIGIERIEGSFYNVMGLPTRLLYTTLIDFIQTANS